MVRISIFKLVLNRVPIIAKVFALQVSTVFQQNKMRSGSGIGCYDQKGIMNFASEASAGFRRIVTETHHFYDGVAFVEGFLHLAAVVALARQVLRKSRGATVQQIGR